MNKRRRYEIGPIIINGRSYWRVSIDPRYENKNINDELILKLVLSLDGREQSPDFEHEGLSYFVTMIELGNQSHRLTWMLEGDEICIGIERI